MIDFERKGRLRLFIGAAPGVGKTYMMLRQAVTLAERGVDVVIGYVDVHGRPETAAQVNGLEVLPRKQIELQGQMFEEIDVDAVVARRPQVVVIDELAHSNVPGSARPKRYLDVEYILDHGIDILTAVNVQHLEDVAEEAEEITGIKVREIIPTSFVKRADEIEVIDVTPETLRQRLRDGSIYSPDKVEQALNHFFRKSNLSALRELALREVAEDVDQRLQRSFDRSKIPGPVGAKETVLACVSFLERCEKLIQKAHRMAERMKGDLLALTVLDAPDGERSGRATERLKKLEGVCDHYDATHIVAQRNDRKLGAVIIEAADRLNVTQIVIGQPQRRNHWMIWRDSPVQYLLRHMKYVDVRIVGWKELVVQTIENDRSPAWHSLVEQSVAQKTLRMGRLTIYVGAAPGVGKTYRMLRDVNDWLVKGVDVVIGLIETHGRPETADQIGHLEVLPKRILEMDGRKYEELDVDGIIRRQPRFVLIDELAHTNVPGCEREKRYQDIEYILAHGINVVTAVNIQHLESLRDKVEHITGIRVRERVPDWFMDLAREVKLIDVTPETLQQRLEDGKIYSLDKVDRALDNFFRIGNLSALREIALLEVADDVDKRLNEQRLRESGAGSRRTWSDRILVCVNYRPHSEKLIRRGWRIADRQKAELYVLVVLDEEMTEDERKDLERVRHLSEQFEATFLTRQAHDHSVGETIVQMARDLGVSQLVIGQPLPVRGWLGRLRGNPVDYVLEHAEFVDLYVVSNARDARTLT